MNLKYVFTVLIFTNVIFAMSLNEVNRASKDELMEIKGIGDAKAQMLIKSRPFSHFSQIDKLKGFGVSLMNNIKNDIKKGSAKTRQSLAEEETIRPRKKINLFEK
ncbi:MAG: helix-hairpin-helix domain-containing protein [Epsilonproteobacteria bacterium]|nr:helix-hairpin-helix domain-containing protein [Campylobacterota bacterium]